jgi:transposase-like protein
MKCPACGTANAPIGTLGKLKHYTCRACGWWYSR